jgi:elongation factor G
MVKKGSTVLNTNIGEKVKIPRLVKMHADELEDITDIRGGDICAMYGVECATGETFTDGTVNYQMTPMFVPEPVVSLGVMIKSKTQSHLLSKALKRFEREDPTFKVSTDLETQEMLISGMGELHLEIYIERLKREYSILCKVSAPKVAYRETITHKIEFDYLHKKQSGGQGQYAKIKGYMEPLGEDEGLKPQFVNALVGQNIPPNYVPAIQKGFEDSCAKGPLIGNPIERIRFVLTDGDHHSVDSSEFAFRLCTQYAFSQAFFDGGPSILQPIMNVEIRMPSEYQQSVLSTVNKRRGNVTNAIMDGAISTLYADVPLAAMFGYAAELRSVTEGKGEFAMEYSKHDHVMGNDREKIIEKYKKLKENEEKKSD